MAGRPRKAPNALAGHRAGRAPLKLVPPSEPAPPAPAEVAAWLARHGVRSVHIGGQREQTSPGIYAAAHGLISEILRLATRPGT
jgi:hypothetical protein